MAYFIIYLIFLPCFIHSRSVHDVIVDFKPAFTEVHKKIFNLEEQLSNEIQPMFDNVTFTIHNENINLNNTLMEMKLDVIQKVWDVLKLTGMNNNRLLVSHCIANLNKTENSLLATTYGGQRICIHLTIDHVNSTTEMIHNLLDDLRHEHFMVDLSKEICAEISHPFDAQTCLIENLYMLYDPYLKEVKKDVETKIYRVAKNIDEAVEEFYRCHEFIYLGINHDVEVMLDDFVMCVIKYPL